MMNRGTIVKVRLTYAGDEPFQSDAMIQLIGVIGAINIGRVESLIRECVNRWGELKLEQGRTGFVEATLIERHVSQGDFINYWLEPIEVTQKFYG